jgi:hypothetical protein
MSSTSCTGADGGGGRSRSWNGERWTSAHRSSGCIPIDRKRRGAVFCRWRNLPVRFWNGAGRRGASTARSSFTGMGSPSETGGRRGLAPVDSQGIEASGYMTAGGQPLGTSSGPGCPKRWRCGFLATRLGPSSSGTTSCRKRTCGRRPTDWPSLSKRRRVAPESLRSRARGREMTARMIGRNFERRE